MIVILNAGAGTNSDGEKEARSKIAEAFRTAGTDVSIVTPDSSKDLTTLAREATESGEGPIVAAGGDGTVSAVAAALAGSDKILGVLPLGTLNHFAKDLGIPLDLNDAARTIMDNHSINVDVAEVNDEVFINNSSLGMYPHIVARREAQQEQLNRGKWPAFAWATVLAFKRFPFLQLRVRVEGKELERKTAFLFVGNNHYEMAGFRTGGRASLQDGKLGLYLTHGTGRIGLLRLALHALFGRLNQADDFEAYSVEEAVIESHRSSLLVARDGEVTRMKPPLRYRIRAGALRVLVPRSENA